MGTSQDLQSKERQLKQLRYFYKSYKDGMKKRQNIVPLDGPCMILLRRNMDSEFYEASKSNLLKKAKFKYSHSNGEDRTIDLTDNYLYTGKYGDNTFKFYIHHEDAKYPIATLSSDPIFEYTQIADAINHSLSANLKWKAEERKASAKMILAVVGGLAVIAGGFILWTVVKQPDPAPVIVVGEATKQVSPLLLFISRKWFTKFLKG